MRPAMSLDHHTAAGYRTRLGELLECKNPAELGLPLTAKILGAFLTRWMPGDSAVQHDTDRTSADIVLDFSLDSMADFTVNDVALTMAWLGFPVTSDPSIGCRWAMVPAVVPGPGAVG